MSVSQKLYMSCGSQDTFPMEWLYNLRFKKKKKTLQPTLQQKIFITKKKNHCNNIEVIAIVYEKCCNKIWGNKFVLPKKFVAINLKYFNENFEVIIYLLLQ